MGRHIRGQRKGCGALLTLRRQHPELSGIPPMPSVFGKMGRGGQHCWVTPGETVPCHTFPIQAAAASAGHEGTRTTGRPANSTSSCSWPERTTATRPSAIVSHVRNVSSPFPEGVGLLRAIHKLRSAILSGVIQPKMIDRVG